MFFLENEVMVVHPILLHVRDLLLLLKNFCFSLFCGITFRDLFHVVLPHEILFLYQKKKAKKRIWDSLFSGTILDSSNVSLKIK